MPDLKWLRYGNWCGPGPYPPSDWNSHPPKNDVDDACMRHDLGYRKCGIVGPLKALRAAFPGGANSCAYDYDDSFIKELESLLSADKLEGKEKLAAKTIVKYFKWKMKHDKPELADEREEKAKKRKKKITPSLSGFKNWLGDEGPPFAF
jgi:hypothetical protein